jgi:hypothetical protein
VVDHDRTKRAVEYSAESVSETTVIALETIKSTRRGTVHHLRSVNLDGAAVLTSVCSSPVTSQGMEIVLCRGRLAVLDDAFVSAQKNVSVVVASSYLPAATT